MTQRERQILNWIEADPMISQQELAERAGITRSSVAVHISNLMKKGCIAGKGNVDQVFIDAKIGEESEYDTSATYEPVIIRKIEDYEVEKIIS